MKKCLLLIYIAFTTLAVQAQDYGTEKDMPLFFEQLKANLDFPLRWQHNKKMKFSQWKKKARQSVMQTLQTPPPSSGFHLQMGESEQREGYSATKCTFNVNDWCRVAAYLLVPEGKGPFPAVLMLHDHGAHFSIGKEKMVRPFGVDSTLVKDADEWCVKCYDGQYAGDYFAQNGYVVLSVDALFWGDRGRKEGVRYDSQQALASNFLQMGSSWGAFIVWDDIRSAQFLATLPMVDKKRIGCLGFSMGAHRSWMTSALSDVIAASANVCWMNDTEHLMTLTNNQNKGGSAYAMIIPGIRNLMDYPDVAALACPKPTLFYNGLRDKLFPVEGVNAAYQLMREVWQSQHAEEKLVLKSWDEPHFFSKAMQQGTLQFFDKWLK